MATAQHLYPAVSGSPFGLLVNGITPTDKDIIFANVGILPQGPNIAVIGSGAAAEYVLYTSVEESVGQTTVHIDTRGAGGTDAMSWPSGTPISRKLTTMEINYVGPDLTNNTRYPYITVIGSDYADYKGILADYVCTGVNDELTILEAIQSIATGAIADRARALCVKLIGTFVLEDYVNLTNDATYDYSNIILDLSEATLTKIWADAPLWAVGTEYDIGDYAVYDSTPYRSLTNGNTGNTPTSTSVYWKTCAYQMILTAGRVVLSETPVTAPVPAHAREIVIEGIVSEDYVGCLAHIADPSVVIDLPSEAPTCPAEFSRIIGINAEANTILLEEPLIHSYTGDDQCYVSITKGLNNFHVYGGHYTGYEAVSHVNLLALYLGSVVDGSVQRGTFTNISRTAIILTPCYNVDIAYNDIYGSAKDGSGYGVHLSMGTRKCRIRNNTIGHCRHHLAGGTYAESGDPTDCSITNNTLYGGDYSNQMVDLHECLAYGMSYNYNILNGNGKNDQMFHVAGVDLTIIGNMSSGGGTFIKLGATGRDYQMRNIYIADNVVFRCVCFLAYAAQTSGGVLAKGSSIYVKNNYVSCYGNAITMYISAVFRDDYHLVAPTYIGKDATRMCDLSGNATDPIEWSAGQNIAFSDTWATILASYGGPAFQVGDYFAMRVDRLNIVWEDDDTWYRCKRNYLTLTAYDAGVDYKLNEFVSYLGKYYLCIAATTAGTAPTDTDYWKEASLYDEDKADYAVNDLVAFPTDNPQYCYRRIKTNVTPLPIPYPNYWELSSTYNPAQTYYPGDIATYTPSSIMNYYVCKQETTNNLPSNTTYWTDDLANMEFWDEWWELYSAQYDDEALYEVGDKVTYAIDDITGFYECIQATTAGILPTDEGYWVAIPGVRQHPDSTLWTRDLLPRTLPRVYVDGCTFHQVYPKHYPSTMLNFKNYANIYVRNCYIHNSCYSAMTLLCCSGMLANNVIVDSCDERGYTNETSATANFEYGDYFTSAGIALSRCENMLVVNNAIENSTSDFVDGAVNHHNIGHEYAIVETSSDCANNAIMGNVFKNSKGLIGNGAEHEILINGTDTILSNNLGYKTKARGTISISDPNTSAVIDHGLDGIPTSIIVTPTSQSATRTYYVNNEDGTNFTINLTQAPGPGTPFSAYWEASL